MMKTSSRDGSHSSIVNLLRAGLELELLRLGQPFSLYMTRLFHPQYKEKFFFTFCEKRYNNSRLPWGKKSTSDIETERLLNPSVRMSGCQVRAYHNISGPHCPVVNDTLLCWGPTLPNRTVSQPCPIVVSEYRAYRTCLPNGTWLNNYTNFDFCWESFREAQSVQNNTGMARILRDITLGTSIVSLVFLLTALFIFCYFRSLQCSRISIHKHLFISFIIQFTVIIYMLGNGTGSNSRRSFRDVDWLCKAFKAVLMYTRVVNFSWMLVEGIYLHNRLVVFVFHSAAPFKLFCFIGWGIPALILALWIGLMNHFYKEPCWDFYAKSLLIFIIYVPIVLALLINVAFLVNIIRVLIVKLRTNNLVESRRIKKAIKATIILLPLLGVANLIFLAHPSDPTAMAVFRVINSFLPCCQGIFVSVLYCFMNSEVKLAISKKWKRFRTNRAMNSRSRRQGSRSSYFLSHSVTGQTDTTSWRGRPPHSSTSRGHDGGHREPKSYTMIKMTPETTPRNGHKVRAPSAQFVSSLKLHNFPKSSVRASVSETPTRRELFNREEQV
ncbi:hypothetical protein RRG08_038126 [Elysia crispata]|uniref:Uncharacterized protein n=1 Tax=Elysia crispata TaxID=231223 RepID=A0AAE0ZYM2_9GAST|nr:hypothetical protein RRG08_038126 [Elysia crispata]